MTQMVNYWQTGMYLFESGWALCRYLVFQLEEFHLAEPLITAAEERQPDPFRDAGLEPAGVFEAFYHVLVDPPVVCEDVVGLDGEDRGIVERDHLGGLVDDVWESYGVEVMFHDVRPSGKSIGFQISVAQVRHPPIVEPDGTQRETGHPFHVCTILGEFVEDVLGRYDVDVFAGQRLEPFPILVTLE